MRHATLLSLLSSVVAHAASPVEKVISLLEDLVAECETEGSAEAKTYDTFACFCKDNTDTKTTSILDGQDNIESLSATIQEKTALKEEKTTEIQERKNRQEELAKTLEETKVRLAKERSEYEALAADLEKAIGSLETAIAALDSSKPAGGTSFLSIKSDLKQQLKESVALAEVMGLAKSAKVKKVNAFLQGKVDPDDANYKYHSQGIIDVLNDLLTDFNKEKRDVDTEWVKTETSENDLIADTEAQMEENSNAMDTLKGDVETLGTEVASAREDLVDAESLLKDDQTYLKDLTDRCEQRAGAWDQRSAARAAEINALTQALTILTDKVQGKDEAANVRALVQERKTPTHTHDKPASFLQSASVRSQVKNLLERARGQSISQNDRKDKVLALLNKEGNRLGSAILSSMAMKVAADPFLKVKELIQKLIERLVAEATAEATKKRFLRSRVEQSGEESQSQVAGCEKVEC